MGMHLPRSLFRSVAVCTSLASAMLLTHPQRTASYPTPQPNPQSTVAFTPVLDPTDSDVQSGALTSTGGVPIVVSMSTSMGGRVTATALTATSTTRRWSGDVSTDGIERTGRAAIQLPNGDVALGTSRGEVAVFRASSNALTVKKLPVDSANRPGDVLDLAYDATFKRIIAGTASPQSPSGSGIVYALDCEHGCASGSWTKVFDTGQLHPSSDQAQASAVGSWNGTVFVGSGLTEGRLVQVNPDGTIQNITPSGESSASRVTQARVVGSYLYATFVNSQTAPSGSQTATTEVLKLTTVSNRTLAVPFDRFSPPAWVVTPPPPGSILGIGPETAIFRGSWGFLYGYDPDRPLGQRLLQLSNSQGTGQVPVSNCWLSDKKTCVTLRSDGSYGLVAVEGSSTSTLTALTSQSDPGIRRISSIAWGPLVGTVRHVYAGFSFFSTRMADVNPSNLASSSMIPVECAGTERDQIESMIATSSGKVMLGLYNTQGGRILTWDPNIPRTCATPRNPTSPTMVESTQARPQAMADIGSGKVAVGTVASKSMVDANPSLTGGLFIYDTQSDSVDDTAYRKMLQVEAFRAHAITALARRNTSLTGGWVYGGASARSDTSDTGTTSLLFRYNLSSRDLQWVGIPNQYMITDVAFGKDGKLYFGGGTRLYVAETAASTWTNNVAVEGSPVLANAISVPGSSGPLMSITPLASGQLVISAGASWYQSKVSVVTPGSPMTFTDMGIIGGRVIVNNSSKWFYFRDGILYTQTHSELGGPLP